MNTAVLLRIKGRSSISTKDERLSCIINIDSTENTEFLEHPSLVQALKGLIRFQTVVLRLVPAYMRCQLPQQTTLLSHRLTKNVDHLSKLDKRLSPELGPSKAKYGGRDYWFLIYHPRSHIQGLRPPEFDVQELANSPAMVSPPRNKWDRDGSLEGWLGRG